MTEKLNLDISKPENCEELWPGFLLAKNKEQCERTVQDRTELTMHELGSFTVSYLRENVVFKHI